VTPKSWIIDSRVAGGYCGASDERDCEQDARRRIRSWNAGAMRLFGYTAEEVIGKPITIIIPPELHEEEHRILAKLQRGERIDHFETTG